MYFALESVNYHQWNHLGPENVESVFQSQVMTSLVKLEKLVLYSFWWTHHTLQMGKYLTVPILYQ